MKKLLLITMLLVIAFPSIADDYVSGYTKANGTYVSGYTRSESNYTKLDNYSTKSNYNPYTGNEGTLNVNTPQQNYGSNYGRGSSRGNYSRGY